MLHAAGTELSTRPARRGRAEDIETKSWILFAEFGFSNVTMEQVASAAGCSIRTVTRLFPTKEDLMLNFARTKNARILAEFEAVDPDEPGILKTLWRCWARLTEQEQTDLERYSLFRQASAGAPEVVDRVTGEQHRMVLTRILLKLRSSRDFARASAMETMELAHLLLALNAATVAAWQEKKQEHDLLTLLKSAEGVLDRLSGVAAAVARPSN